MTFLFSAFIEVLFGNICYPSGSNISFSISLSFKFAETLVISIFQGFFEHFQGVPTNIHIDFPFLVEKLSFHIKIYTPLS
jgi:hypothetical protein